MPYPPNPFEIGLFRKRKQGNKPPPLPPPHIGAGII